MSRKIENSIAGSIFLFTPCCVNFQVIISCKYHVNKILSGFEQKETE